MSAEPDICLECKHSWHGLTCTASVGYDEYPHCFCPGPFGAVDKDPDNFPVETRHYGLD